MPAHSHAAMPIFGDVTGRMSKMFYCCTHFFRADLQKRCMYLERRGHCPLPIRNEGKRNMVYWYSLLIWLTLLQLHVGADSADTNQELLKWVRDAEGGYFNDKLELRSDENGLFGVFAAQDIRKNQVLASIPWSCILYSEDSNHRFQDCEVVRLLDEELNKEAPSLYAQGLKKTVREHASLLPVNWSKKGKELFLKVTGNGILPPEDPFMQDFEWKHKCDQVSRNATLLVMTHGEDFGMVPLTDKFNNRGGNWTGAHFGLRTAMRSLVIEFLPLVTSKPESKFIRLQRLRPSRNAGAVA